MTQPGPQEWEGEGADPWMPQRLQAQAQVAVGERTIYDDYYARLAAWLAVAGQATLAGVVPNPDAILNLAPRWVQSMTDFVHTSIAEMVGGAYLRVFGPGYRYDDRPFVVDYLARARNRLVEVPDQTYALIAGQVAEGATAGESIGKIADRVRQTFDVQGTPYWQNRPTVVARTECLPPWARVDAAHATAVYRRPYSGEWITVRTEAGREFAGTTNHPVLTTRGWVGLGQLSEGDNLVCHPIDIESSRPARNQDVAHPPASIAEIFDATQAVGVTVRSRTGKPDFHGDGREGYVDVVYPRGMLRVGRFSPVTQGLCEGVLSPSDAGKVVGCCERAPFVRSLPLDQLSGLRPGSGLYPGCLDYRPDRLLVDAVSVTQGLRGLTGDVARHDLTVRELVAAAHLIAGGHELGAGLLQCAHGYAARPQLARHYGGIASERLADSSTGHSRKVQLDSVISVDVGTYSGHVFNLTTVQGYFASGGVYTGNTIGALNAGRQGAFTEVAFDLGEQLEKGWLATTAGPAAERTRPTHRAADIGTPVTGQRVPLDRPFMVGGFPGMFPGAPELPAEESIQCRCTMLILRPGEDVDLSNRQLSDF